MKISFAAFACLVTPGLGELLHNQTSLQDKAIDQDHQQLVSTAGSLLGFLNYHLQHVLAMSGLA